MNPEPQSATTAPAAPKPRLAPNLPLVIPSLNGLRGVSVVLVFIAHTAGTANAPRLLDPFIQVGNLGVKIFFVISGFLITTLLMRELDDTGTISLRAFYLRRTIRIFPAFYAFVFVMVGLHLFGLIPLTVSDIVHALTYTMNFNAHAQTMSFDFAKEWYFNHLWSLSVEEQFYLVWPLTLFFVGSRRGVLVAAGTIAAVPLIRLAMAYGFPALPPAAYTRQFQAVADSLATGCLLALGFNWLGSRRGYVKATSSRLFFLVAGAGIVAALLLFKLDKASYYVFGQSLVNVIIGVSIDRVVRFPETLSGRLLASRSLQFIGALSYSLYLWQEPFLNPFNETSPFTRFPVNVLCAVLAALASYYLVEKQFLKLKGRFHSRETTPPAVKASLASVSPNAG